MLVGDLDADPSVIPSLADGMADEAWIDVSPPPTCQFQFDEGKGTRGDFALACTIALAAATACQVLPDRWFSPHFDVRTDFFIAAWDATVEINGQGILPFGLHVGFNAPIAPADLLVKQFKIFGMPIFRSSALCP